MSEQASTSRQDAGHRSGRDGFEGYVPATQEFRAACANLFPGQMVCSPDFTLMDSMAALQIMDPRMDSGIFPIPSHLIAEGDRTASGVIRKSKFVPHARLSAEEVCWIIDRLLACEMAWHRGASLSQTIHTCLYVHELASIHPNAPPIAGQETNGLVSRVLRPMLMAVLKSVGLAWDEMAKGNVVDGEDFNGEKAGISLMEDVSPEDAIAMLHEAEAYVKEARKGASPEDVRADLISEGQADALTIRIILRRNILLSMYSLARVDPTQRLGDVKPVKVLLAVLPIVDQAQSSLQAMVQANPTTLTLLSPSFSHAPSADVTLTFDPWYSRRPAHVNAYNAPSAPPPPPPLQLGSPQDTIKTCSELLEGISEAADLATVKVGWVTWVNFFTQKALSFQREETLPYVRSLWQSIVCTNGIIGLQWPLTFIAEAFLYDCAGLNVAALTTTIVNQVGQGGGREASLSIKKRIDYLLERLAGQLVNHLCSLAQNRARGKRRLAASYESLVELSAEAAALDSSLVDTLGVPIDLSSLSTLAIQALTLDTMLHIVFSGFELELHRMEECSLAYWIAFRIAEEKLEVVAAMLDNIMAAKEASEAKVIGHLQSQICYTKGLAGASKAMQYLFQSTSFVRHPSLPWQPSVEDALLVRVKGEFQAARPKSSDSLEAIHKVAFEKRFKWLNDKSRPEARTTLDNLWADFKQGARMIKAQTVTERRDNSRDILLEAVTDLRRETVHEGAHYVLLLAASLEEIAEACKTYSNNLSTTVTLLPLTFAHTHSHPWFPVLCSEQC